MMKKIAAFVVLAFSFTLTACHQKTASDEFYDNYKQIKISDVVLKSDTKGTSKNEAEKLLGKPDSKEKIDDSQVIWNWKKDSIKMQVAFSNNDAYMKTVTGLKWGDNKKISSAFPNIKKGDKTSQVIDKCGRPNTMIEASILNQHNKSYRYKTKTHEYNFIFDEKNKLIKKEMK